MNAKRRLWLFPIAMIGAFWTAFGIAQEAQRLGEEEMRQFLSKAEVVGKRQLGKGVTGIWRLTLSDGKITHDAAFQSIDEYAAVKQFPDGHSEMDFRDCFRYDIAAFELAKLLGLRDMMPVTVRRKWGGKDGALSWWLPVKMDEEKRLKDQIEPPDVEAWNRQMCKMRVFAQLVYDTDRNLGNVLISEDWHLWMIDFTRAFRRWPRLENPANLTRCSRELLENIRQLDAGRLARIVGLNLTKGEIGGVMARRDLIVAHFENLVAQKGEKAVLF